MPLKFKGGPEIGLRSTKRSLLAGINVHFLLKGPKNASGDLWAFINRLFRVLKFIDF